MGYKKAVSTNSMSYHVYIVECSDKTLYVGCTNDLRRRIFQHNFSKGGAHYTKIRRPIVLKYSEPYKTYKAARRREAKIKRLQRKEKLDLIGTKKE